MVTDKTEIIVNLENYQLEQVARTKNYIVIDDYNESSFVEDEG